MIKTIDADKCTGCGICVEYCPMDVLRLDTFQEEVPPCQVACPAGVDMRGYIYLLRQGDFDCAMELVREALPLPAITGHICFHPCESQCARREVDEAVNINAIERFVADYWLKEKAEPMPRLHVARVAVVGSGPAGLSAAYYLVRMGYPVTVFESMPEFGGMLRYGIPEYHLPREMLDAQISYIRDRGVEFKANIAVGRDITLDELKDKGYRAVFIAVGTHKSLKLDIPGEDLEGVKYGLDFLRDVNTGKQVKAGQKVVVVGGGNVAIDAARTALRLRAGEVRLIYRRSAEEMPAHREEVEQAEKEGVKTGYLTAPARITGKDGRVEGLECIRMTLGELDASGRREPVPVAGSEFMIEADMIIPSVGEAPDLAFWADKDGFSVTPEGTLKVDAKNLRTRVPGIFAGGDVVTGASSVVEAMASGKKAAIAIDCYLTGDDLEAEMEACTVEKPPKEGIEKEARRAMPLLPVEDRIRNFKEVRTGFDEETAMAEAQRCMTCGSQACIVYHRNCMTCYNCELGCPYEALYVDPFRKVMPDLITYAKR